MTAAAAGVGGVGARLSGRLRPAEVLGLAALLSLFATTRYPVAVRLGEADVTAQDLLFAALILVSLPSLIGWVRTHRVPALILGALLVLLAVSALRSPLGGAGPVAVGKYAEFVVAGICIGLVLVRLRQPELVTMLLTAAIAAVAASAFAELVGRGGLGALVRERAGGPLSYQSAFAAAGFTAIWCSVRAIRPASVAERRLAALGLVAAAAVSVLTKSVLLLGGLLALAALFPLLRSRRLVVGAAVCVALAAAATAGRADDLRSATGAGPRSYMPAPPVAVPPSGPPPVLPLRVPAREPASVTGGSFTHRIALAYMGIRIAADAPLLGRGWLAASDPRYLRSHPSDEYMVERFPRLEPTLMATVSPTTSHNAYIQTWLEAGAPAALLLVALVLATVVPAAAVLARDRSGTPWLVGVCLGTAVLVAVWLASITLYGGQLETCLLGIAVGLSTSARPPARWWLAGAATAVAGIGLLAAFLLLPAGEDRPHPLTRARAVDDSGRQLYQGRSVPARTLRLVNGLTEVAVAGDRLVMLSEPALAAERPQTTRIVRIPALANTRLAHVVSSTADRVHVRLESRAGTSLVSLWIGRGVPGVHVSIRGRRSIEVRSPRRIFEGPDLARVRDPGDGRRATGSPRLGPFAIEPLPGGPAAVVLVPFQPVATSTRPERVVFRASGGREGRFFVAFHPGPQRRRALPPGVYLAGRDRGAGFARLVRVPRDQRLIREGAALVPFIRADATRSGVAEMISLGTTYRPRGWG